MGVSYKKLWKLLIDKDMKKRDLKEAANLSPSIITKLNQNRSVTVSTLARICTALNCRIEDMMEITQDDLE
ncbi:MAG TPA: XRE family transcriptional regulator [Ruminococcaceae bacterium]|nr:XRE family transcriptional regulator [Oscillospiraceae bacterium]